MRRLISRAIGSSREKALAWFSEKQFQLADGSVLNYGEAEQRSAVVAFARSDGVMENYHKVLPELAKHYQSTPLITTVTAARAIRIGIGRRASVAM